MAIYSAALSRRPARPVEKGIGRAVSSDQPSCLVRKEDSGLGPP